MHTKSLGILFWLTLIHLAGIYLYIAGFLLTRRPSSGIAACPEGQYCILPATTKRVVLLVIDSLRFDFLSPDPPGPVSSYHHVLRLPSELSEQEPERSLLFSSYADPPTTTLQRIKGITAGLIPTFIDLGSNFGFSVTDSWIGQLQSAGKKIAFMGDDTWLSIFPTSFAPNMTYTYDSFNVEDFDTVDNGIIEHLLPLLRDESKPWDAIITHFLGVDHVGHRVGPDHPAMKTKLEHMDNMLRDVVSLLDDDTLLFLLGDHGMDRRGNHGCDTEHEVTVGVWLYSKGRPFLHQPYIPSPLLPKSTLSGATLPQRIIQQIDLAPSIALILGLPIPFNNLGSIIPELFWDDISGEQYDRALRLNAAQVHRYLETHRASFIGSGLDWAWPQLEDLWQQTISQCGNLNNTLPSLTESWKFGQHSERRVGEWAVMHGYLDTVLTVCRSSWTRFDLDLIAMGLLVLLFGALSSLELWHKLSSAEAAWEVWAAKALWHTTCAAGAGASIAVMMLLFLQRIIGSVAALQRVLFSASLFSTFAMTTLARPLTSFPSFKFLRKVTTAGPIILALHAATFGSTFLIVWEDHVATFLLLSALVPPILAGITAPTPRLRYRILGFTAVFAACVRLMAASTVCREEQHPQCEVTFFTSASLTAPPKLVRVLALPSAAFLSYLMRRILRHNGLETPFFSWLMPAVLMQGCLPWTLEWIEVSNISPARSALLRPLRTLLGWTAVGTILIIGRTLWLTVLKTQPKKLEPKKENQAVSFADVYGVPYLMFWCIPLGIVHTMNQLTAQIMLGLAIIALISYLEVLGSIRSARGFSTASSSSTSSSMVTFSDIVPLALLTLHTFYATGHQATISSVQWKTAFVLTPTLNMAISPITLLINEAGPSFLLALAVPLVVLWNRDPIPHASSTARARRESMRAALGMTLYHSVLLLSSAITCVWYRRHPMIWKVFVPRLIVAAFMLVVVDISLLLGVGFGVSRVSDSVARLLLIMHSDTQALKD